MKKSLLLVFTLAIPVSIFLFLKLFGYNEFEVPVLFENGIPGCGNEGRAHRIVWQKNQLPPALMEGNDYLIIAYGPEIVDDQALYAEIVRISDAFSGLKDLAFILLFTPDILPGPEEQPAKLNHYLVRILMKTGNLNDFLSCQLGLNADEREDKKKLVLLDKEGRIRGMYRIDEQKQTDQLILELKILTGSDNGKDKRTR